VTSGQFVKTPLVRPDWSTPSQEIGAPGEPVAAGIGVGMSLVAKMQGMPGGFEENYGQMLGAILDEGDKLADPRPAIAAWDDSPGSLQTKIANDYLMYPGGDIEARYRRVKAKSTLMEAAALDRLMRLVRPR
jgi:hypothetical protein